MVFASLSFLVSNTSSIEVTLAARTPFTLLQAIDIPMPLPQIAIPKSISLLARASPNLKAYKG